MRRDYAWEDERTPGGEAKNVSITRKLGFSAFNIENKINLNITSPDNFLTCASTLVSTDSSSNIPSGINPKSSFAVIKQN